MLNEGQKYCRMLQGEHSAILSTFYKLPFIFKTFVLSIFQWPLKTGFEWPLKTGFTVYEKKMGQHMGFFTLPYCGTLKAQASLNFKSYMCRLA